jgi:hypothetical protein
LDRGDLVGARADVDRRRVAVEAEIPLRGAKADQDRTVDVGCEYRSPENPANVEPLAADPDSLAPVEPVDPEPLSGDGAEHRDRQAGGRSV